MKGEIERGLRVSDSGFTVFRAQNVQGARFTVCGVDFSVCAFRCLEFQWAACNGRILSKGFKALLVVLCDVPRFGLVGCGLGSGKVGRLGSLMVFSRFIISSRDLRCQG